MGHIVDFKKDFLYTYIYELLNIVFFRKGSNYKNKHKALSS